jgi:hypothetical protein
MKKLEAAVMAALTAIGCDKERNNSMNSRAGGALLSG